MTFRTSQKCIKKDALYYRQVKIWEKLLYETVKKCSLYGGVQYTARVRFVLYFAQKYNIFRNSSTLLDVSHRSFKTFLIIR